MTAVLGVDPSLTSTGLAEFFLEPGELPELSFCAVKSTGKATDTVADTAGRIRYLASQFCDWSLLGEIGYDLAVVEGPSYASKGGKADERAGLRWAYIDMLTVVGIPIAIVSPSARAKYATGKGGADKDAVIEAVNRLYGYLLPEPLGKRDNDVADAIVPAAMGMRYLGFPIEAEELSPAQLEAMVKVAWPEVDT
jgi:Holliday junction resolvasome RuvABC endonuclease subunit